VANSKAANNFSGVNSTNSTIFLNGSTVTGNFFGFQVGTGGVINSYGNNAITDTNNNGGLTHAALQ
jgi:hypothetical protein